MLFHSAVLHLMIGSEMFAFLSAQVIVVDPELKLDEPHTFHLAIHNVHRLSWQRSNDLQAIGRPCYPYASNPLSVS